MEGEAEAKWQPPAVPPETAKLRAWLGELEAGLRPGTPRHLQWCVGKLFVLPSRNGDTTTSALQADNFIDACGHFPDDLLSAATLELLQTKKFRPSPAEMVEIAGPKYAERQRMLERVNLMLGGKSAADPEKPFEPEPLIDRVRAMRDSLRRIGQVGRAAVRERELAELEGREPEEWARQASTVAPTTPTERPPFRPEDTPTAKRCAELAAARRDGREPAEDRDIAEFG